MNNITKEILINILPNAYNNKGYLRLNYVIDRYHAELEARYYDEIFFPRMARAMRLAKGWIVPEWAYQTWNIGYRQEFEADWIIDTDWQDLFFDRMEPYLDRLFFMGEYAYEAITQEDILSLGVIPNGQLRLPF